MSHSSFRLLVGLDEELFWSGGRGNPILGRLPIKEDSDELIAAVGEGSSFLEYDVHLGLGHMTAFMLGSQFKKSQRSPLQRVVRHFDNDVKRVHLFKTSCCGQCLVQSIKLLECSVSVFAVSRTSEHFVSHDCSVGIDCGQVNLKRNQRAMITCGPL